ncbi:hypothetical protein ACWGOQ_0020615 [Aquimarina sp. M1]
MVKRLTFILVAIGFLACSTKLQEIPLDQVSKDMKLIAGKTANNIIGFCDNEEDFNEFKLRTSTKSFVHFRTGKYALTCNIYENQTSKIKLGELYKVDRLKAYVKRFKYKLQIVSEVYESMELHVDLNSDKNVADYKIYGKAKGGKWLSVIDELKLDVLKQMNKNK